MIKNLRIKNNEDYKLKISSDLSNSSIIQVFSFESENSNVSIASFPFVSNSVSIEVSFLNSILSTIKKKSYYKILVDNYSIVEGNLLIINEASTSNSTPTLTTFSSVGIKWIETLDSDPGDLVAIFEDGLI